MTLDYPVRNPTLTAAADRAAWLDRMRLVYDDAIRAIGLGMAGKWVGHPAQLLAVLLAFEASFSAGAVEGEAAKLEAYAAALAAERGDYYQRGHERPSDTRANSSAGRQPLGSSNRAGSSRSESSLPRNEARPTAPSLERTTRADGLA